jgi:hypothetical protein
MIFAMEAGLVRSQAPVTSVLSDDELLAAITRDLRSIYSEIIKQPIPEKLAGVLKRLSFGRTYRYRSLPRM